MGEVRGKEGNKGERKQSVNLTTECGVKNAEGK
jgi:hypothetical protein